jgi:hypothetical protein
MQFLYKSLFSFVFSNSAFGCGLPAFVLFSSHFFPLQIWDESPERKEEGKNLD